MASFASAAMPSHSTKSSPKRAAKKNAAPMEPKLSRQKRPGGMESAEWQVALRRQFGREQSFLLENLGSEPIFSEFAVTNPDSKRRYRLVIRGNGLGENFCSCPDFATNNLGTCKHIEFTLGKLQAKRGAKSALRRGFEPSYSEIHLQYGGRRSIRFRAGSDCPPELIAAAAELFQDGDLPQERFAELPALLAEAGRVGHELRCYDDALAFVAEVRDGERRREILAAAYPQGAASSELAGLLKVPLYPYQMQGALFAARAGRALIGDEMGLGKTIQAIGAAEILARYFGIERVLVICPTSLKHQWQKEFERFSGRSAQVVAGLRLRRQEQYREPAFAKITNYETLAKDQDLIRTWAPDLVILDEAQRIKNWSTIAARAVKSIVSPYAVVLTGTPLENRLEELISIVQFVDQHRLGPTWRLLDEHQKRDDNGRVVGYQGLDRIGATLAPIMLRRRKKEVLAQLPERVDNLLFVPMTPEQKAHHDDAAEIVTRIVSRWRRTGFLSESDQRRLQCALTVMRMSCNSTWLVDKETDHGHKADELMAVLEEILADPEAKVVIFSQWLGTHELIQNRLRQPGREDWGHVLFHGGVPGEKRGALVDRFLEDPTCRLFLSTDAGGVGLNLQHAAAVVINMDLPWNPAVLEQRIGRVHRLGQQRSVQVVNFVAQGTIEEGMLSVLAFKKSLFEGVLDGGESEITLEGSRLARFMETVAEVSGAAQKAATEEVLEAGEVGEVEEAGEVADASVRVVEEETAIEPAIRPEAPAAPKGDETMPTQTGEVSEPAAAVATAANPWAPLLEVGLQLAQTLAQAHSASSVPDGEPKPGGLLETDPKTGQRYLKLPVPEPAVVQNLANALAGLLAGLKG